MSTEPPTVIVHGTIGAGFHVIGPFDDPDDALRYVHRLDHEWWVMPVSKVSRDAKPEFCILSGDLVDGYIVVRYGTLDACEAAIASIQEQVSLKSDAEFHIASLRRIGTPACYGVAVRGARGYGLLRGYER